MIRFNHIEVTVPPGFVARHATALTRFFVDIFNFEPSPFPGMTTPYLVYKTDPDASQFIFIAEHATPVISPADDHLGFHVDSAAEVENKLLDCRALQQHDSRLEIRDLGVLDLDATLTRGFYVRYLLPIWFDVQNITYKPGFESAFVWQFQRAAAK